MNNFKKVYASVISVFFTVAHSVLFWSAVNFIICASVIFLRFGSVPAGLALAGDAFNVIFSFASGGMISFLFYYLVVYLPDNRKSKILKSNIVSNYQRIRTDVVIAVAMSSMKGGRADITGAYDELIKLTDVNTFKEKFSSGKEANEGFYAFENQMQSKTYEFEIILKKLNLLSSQLNFFLHNYSVKDSGKFDRLKSFEIGLLSLVDSRPGYEESKPLCGFIYSWLAGWDWSRGYHERDEVFEALKNA